MRVLPGRSFRVSPNLGTQLSHAAPCYGKLLIHTLKYGEMSPGLRMYAADQGEACDITAVNSEESEMT